MKLFSSAAPRVCLPTPTHSGPAWSPAPLPGAAQGQERCGNFPSDSAAGWLLLRSLAWHRHQAGWASFPAGPGPAQPRLTLCRLQGQEWVSGPRYPAPSLRPRPCFPPPAPACSLCPGLFPPIFLLSYFLRLSLWAAPDSSKNPLQEICLLPQNNANMLLRLPEPQRSLPSRDLEREEEAGRRPSVRPLQTPRWGQEQASATTGPGDQTKPWGAVSGNQAQPGRSHTGPSDAPGPCLSV